MTTRAEMRARQARGCGHATIENHTRNAYVAAWRTWICSVCTREFRWDGESGYFGAIECKRCCMAIIEAVYCSGACENLLRARMPGGEHVRWYGEK